MLAFSWIFIGALIGGLIAQASKKVSMAGGIIAGALLGPLAFLILLCEDGKEPCPYCGERIRSNAEICPYCHQSRTKKPTSASAAPETKPVPAQSDEQTSVKVHCPFCNQKYEVEDLEGEAEVVCVQCGRKFTLKPSMINSNEGGNVESGESCEKRGGAESPAMRGATARTDLVSGEAVEAFRQALLQEFILSDLDPVAKDKVLKKIAEFRKNPIGG